MEETVKRKRLLREQSLIEPDVQNPFTHKIKLTTLDKIQVGSQFRIFVKIERDKT